MDELRIRLIERLCRLPEVRLAEVETFLVRLESDLVPVATLPASNRQNQIQMAQGKDWPHAPVHRLSEHGTFIITGSTLHKHHFFRSEEKLTLLEQKLLALAKQHDVVLEAWAAFSNHYHFVAHTTGIENRIAHLIARLHRETAEELNRSDCTVGRPVWFNYWDTQLTFEKSYLARLNYVHQNAVKHGLVRQANEYRWCSAAWFEATATRSQVNTIYGFKTDRLNIDDDYQPVV